MPKRFTVSALISQTIVICICMQFTLLLVADTCGVAGNIFHQLTSVRQSQIWIWPPIHKHRIYDSNWFAYVKVNSVIEIKYIKCFEIQIIGEWRGCGQAQSIFCWIFLSLHSFFFWSDGRCYCRRCCCFSLFYRQQEWLVFTHQKKMLRQQK